VYRGTSYQKKLVVNQKNNLSLNKTALVSNCPEGIISISKPILNSFIRFSPQIHQKKLNLHGRCGITGHFYLERKYPLSYHFISPRWLGFFVK